ncbi:MAG: PQQ-binding-like beta-propeller repeat protein, partial [Candidatus Thermoplasmatota archaeon]
MTYNFTKKLLVILISISFLLVINPVCNKDVEAVNNYENPGNWYFEGIDENQIDEDLSNNYEVGSGIATLDRLSSFTREYNFTDGRNHLMKAKSSGLFINLDETLFQLKNQRDEAEVKSDGHEYVDNKAVDTVNNDTEKLVNSKYILDVPFHHFIFNMGDDVNQINKININWYGNKSRTENISSVMLYIWKEESIFPYFDFSFGVWEKLTETTVSSDSLVISEEKSQNLTQYFDDEGKINLLLIGKPNYEKTPRVLSTDFINITADFEEVYANEGTAVSTTIAGSDVVGRWQSLEWDGRYTEGTTSLTVQLLRKKGADWIPISDANLTGNEDGFAKSPVDISMLEDKFSENGLKIRVFMQTNDDSYRPSLLSWGVLWQLNNYSYRDEFLSPTRIDKKTGLKIQDGKVSVEKYYDDWSIYGYMPDNNRAYMGADLGNSEPSTFWTSEGKYNLGGGRRAPVVYENTSYISNNEGTIYAFNMTDQGFEEYRNVSCDISDCSLAASENHVVVATSKLKNNYTNKIIAYNKNFTLAWQSNLSLENGICFSSPPNINDGKIYVSSWNGFNISFPMASYLEIYNSYVQYVVPFLPPSLLDTQLFGEFLNLLTNGNNKLYVLEEETGNVSVDYDLPAGSFSTPCVDDGKIYVGCNNIMGDSLIAYDEVLEKKIWSADVGLVGTSSPVVYEDKVFIMGYKQNLTSVKANVTLYALDKENGDLIWNYTLENSNFSIDRLPKGLGLYNYVGFTCTPAVSEDQLYITTPKGRLICYNTDTGEILWQKKYLDTILDLTLRIQNC